MIEKIPPFTVVCLLPQPVVAALDLWRMEQPHMPSREDAAALAVERWLMMQGVLLPAPEDERR